MNLSKRLTRLEHRLNLPRVRLVVESQLSPEELASIEKEVALNGERLVVMVAVKPSGEKVRYGDPPES